MREWNVSAHVTEPGGKLYPPDQNPPKRISNYYIDPRTDLTDQIAKLQTPMAGSMEHRPVQVHAVRPDYGDLCLWFSMIYGSRSEAKTFSQVIAKLGYPDDLASKSSQPRREPFLNFHFALSRIVGNCDRLWIRLPTLLEKSLERGWRAVVQAGSAERVEALDAVLWSYRDDSFLPHGTAADGERDLQPVFLTHDAANPNSAQVRFLVDGAVADDVRMHG